MLIYRWSAGADPGFLDRGFRFTKDSAAPDSVRTGINYESVYSVIYNFTLKYFFLSKPVLQAPNQLLIFSIFRTLVKSS